MSEDFDILCEAARTSEEDIEKLLIFYLNCVASGDIGAIYRYDEKMRTSVKNHEKSKIYIAVLDGIAGYFQSDGDKAEKAFTEVLPPNYEWKNKEIQGCVESLKAGNCRSQGQFDRAIFHLNNSLELLTPTGILAKMLVMSYYQLGEIHRVLAEFKQAEVYYKKGIEIGKYGNTNMFRLYSGLGNLYLQNDKFPEAKEYLELAATSHDSSSQSSRAFFDLGQYYQKIEAYDDALKHCTESYKIRMDNSLFDAAISCKILEGKILLKKGDIDTSISILEEALSNTENFTAKVKTKEIYGLLSRAYESKGDWERAYISFQKFEKIQSDIYSSQQKEIFKLKNQEIQKQKEIIEKVHGEVQASINYAKRIQKAILPPDSFVQEHLNQSFVLYKPKDVVAGDFYWMEVVGNTLLFAAADCTGHGVPGAMVSVICHNAMNRAVREFGLTEPALILDKTREIVVQEFEKSEEDVKDGMDIALCALSGNSLQYAGAHNPLWIVRGGELLETKADKQPIGKFDKSTPYTNHTVELQDNDLIYVFTDGYADQFGGPDGKKFMSKRFKELLLSIHNEPMKEQEELLDETFTAWMEEASASQIDDVCVLGVQV